MSLSMPAPFSGSYGASNTSTIVNTPIQGNTRNIVPHSGSTAWAFDGDNEPETTQIFLHEWNNGIENDISVNNLVFSAKSEFRQSNNRLVFCLNLGQLNEKLREFGEDAEKMYESGQSLNVHSPNTAYLKVLRDSPTDTWNLDKLTGNINKLKYLTNRGVMNTFNLIGTVEHGTNYALDDSSSSSSTKGKRQILVAVNGRAYITNYWGRVSKGDHLWLILKRVKNLKNEYLPGLLFVPFYSSAREIPPLWERKYEDISKTCEQVGECIYIGEVQETHNCSEVRQYIFSNAAGLTGNHQDQKNTQKSNKRLKIKFASKVWNIQ